jgi:cysteine-rich repeat protein
MDRAAPYVLSAVLLCGVGAAVMECGSSAVCGNGVMEGNEQCDNGALNGTPGNPCSATCTLVSVQRASLTVTYERLHVVTADYPSFPAPTCADLGIDKAHLVLDGPAPQDVSMSCGTNFSFDPIMPGTYQATVTLLDVNGAALTKPVKSMMVATDVGQSPTIDIVFQTTDYLKTYTGNFDFVPWWGTLNTACAAASVNKQTLTMTLPGSTTPVAMMTNDGMKLDGTQGNCFTGTDTMPQEVKSMPWGHYDLVVTGKVGGTVSFCRKFDIFVGVGVAVPTYDLVVTPPMADADGGAATCP